MLGIPSSVSIADDSGFDVRNHSSARSCRTWRVRRNLTVNVGLRFEYENGIKEQQDRTLLWFDPEAAGGDCGQRPRPPTPPVRSPRCRPASSRFSAAAFTRAPRV